MFTLTDNDLETIRRYLQEDSQQPRTILTSVQLMALWAMWDGGL